MPSPNTLVVVPHYLVRSPLLGDTFLISNTCSVNYSKFPRSKLVFLPKLSSPITAIADNNDASNPNGIIDHKGISFVEKHNSLPIKQENPETIDVYGKTSKLQVDNFVAAIKALPCKDKFDIINIFTRDGQICSITVFNDFLMALVITNEPDLAFKLYSDISSLGLAPDSWTFSIIIRCHCKRDDVDEAKRVLDHMLENGLNPNAATFTILINSFCKRGKLQKAFEVFEVMDRIGCKPTVQTYNCLLKGLCYVGRVEEAFELLQDIKKSSIEPDIYTYTALMDGFCKVGRSNEAMELLNEALEMRLTPSVVTYNTLFDGYSREGRPLEGISVLKKMKQRNCLPDYISYSTLLHGLLMWGKIRAALRIYKEMVGNGFEVDERLMNNLLRGLCRKFLKENDLLEDAYQVFDKMQKRAHVIDHSTYCLVIRALSVGKKVDKALVSLHQMIKFGYIPRVTTINTVIRAFCAEGKVEKAFLVLILAYETHNIPSKISYDLMIQELNRHGRFLGACNVYGAALVRGVVTNKKPRQSEIAH